jgi:hypothetical protein
MLVWPRDSGILSMDNQNSLTAISHALFPEKENDPSTKSDDYYEIYESHFKEIKNSPLNIVELGVLEGKSTKVFATYFRHSRILALDLELREIDFSHFQNVVYAKCDQNDQRALSDICKTTFPSGIDLVIDDAAHIGFYSLNSFFALFPLLCPGGFYVIEDWGTGYWSDWTDGKTFQSHICSEASGGLPKRIKSHDFGMVGLIKLLIDYVAGSDVRPTHGSPKTRGSLIDMMEVHFGTVLLKKAEIPPSKAEFLPIAIQSE